MMPLKLTGMPYGSVGKMLRTNTHILHRASKVRATREEFGPVRASANTKANNPRLNITKLAVIKGLYGPMAYSLTTRRTGL